MFVLERFFGLCLVAVVSGVASPALALPDVTAEEFALYMDWKEGREDPRLANDSEKARMRKIARSLGVRVNALQAAIDKVIPHADALPKDTEKAIRATLNETPLKRRVLEVVVDARQAHVIGWLKWRCGEPRDFEKEAAWAAWAVAQNGNIIRTIGIWCLNEVSTKLFSAKIAKTAASRINKSAIERFAASRYIKLFEDVKRGPHK